MKRAGLTFHYGSGLCLDEDGRVPVDQVQPDLVRCAYPVLRAVPEFAAVTGAGYLKGPPRGLTRVDDVTLGNERTRCVRCLFRQPVCFVVLRKDGRRGVLGHQLERLRTTVRADKARATRGGSGRAIATTCYPMIEKVEPEKCLAAGRVVCRVVRQLHLLHLHTHHVD